MRPLKKKTAILIVLVLLHAITAIALLISIAADQSDRGLRDDATAERFADQMSLLSQRVETLNIDQQRALVGYCRTMADQYLKCTRARASSLSGIDRLLQILLGIHIAALLLVLAFHFAQTEINGAEDKRERESKGKQTEESDKGPG